MLIRWLNCCSVAAGGCVTSDSPNNRVVWFSQVCLWEVCSLIIIIILATVLLFHIMLMHNDNAWKFSYTWLPNHSTRLFGESLVTQLLAATQTNFVVLHPYHLNHPLFWSRYYLCYNVTLMKWLFLYSIIYELLVIFIISYITVIIAYVCFKFVYTSVFQLFLICFSIIFKLRTYTILLCYFVVKIIYVY